LLEQFYPETTHHHLAGVSTIKKIKSFKTLTAGRLPVLLWQPADDTAVRGFDVDQDGPRQGEASPELRLHAARSSGDVSGKNHLAEWELENENEFQKLNHKTI
jgi:predicted secreted hydrolase